MYCAQCGNQLIKPTLQLMEYIHNRCTELPATRFSTPWVPCSESLHSSYSTAYEMVRNMQHSHTCSRRFCSSIVCVFQCM